MKWVNFAVILLAVLGLGVSGYLLLVHIGYWTAVCFGVGNCEVVNTSIYSEFLGIPVALLGGLAYLAFIGLSLLVLGNIYADYARLARFLLAAIGLVFSAYLTYIEVFVLREICPWCVTSAVLVILITILSVLDLRSPGEGVMVET